MKHVNTTDMYFQVINCEEVDELKQILNKYSPYYSNWRDYVNNVMLTKYKLKFNKLRVVQRFGSPTRKFSRKDKLKFNNYVLYNVFAL